MGEGTDPRTFPLGVRTVILRESRTTAVEGVISMLGLFMFTNCKVSRIED